MMKLTKLSVLIALTMSTALPVGASITPALMDEQNKQLVAKAKSDVKTYQQTQDASCADPNEEGSLAQKQAEVMEEQKKMATKPINLGNIYSIGKKNGCFAALSDFPDLSISIPSLTGMLNSVKDTLVKYAVRKACIAVDQAFEEMLAPLESALDKVSDRGQLDLTGMVNKQVTKQLYEVDPELGRLGVTGKDESEYEFKW